MLDSKRLPNVDVFQPEAKQPQKKGDDDKGSGSEHLHNYSFCEMSSLQRSVDRKQFQEETRVGIIDIITL